MKRFKALAYAALAAYCLLSLAIFFTQPHAQLTQGWKRDAALHVTATTSAADTDLRSVTTQGWDKVVIHNKDATIWVGAFAIIKGRSSEVAGIDTFTEMVIFIPPDGSLAITDENVAVLRLITESSTADIIIERHEKI